MRDTFTGIGILGGIAIGFFVLLGLGLGLFVLNQEVLRWEAPIIGKTERIQIVNSGEFQLRAYNHFFDLCASVKSAETRIDNAKESLDSSQQGDRNYDVFLLNYNAAKQSRADAVNQYNADATKDWSEGIFLDADLPWQISTEYQPYGGKTTCATR